MSAAMARRSARSSVRTQMRWQLRASLWLGVLCSGGSARQELEKTPYPCKEKYDPAAISAWVDKHLAGAKEGNDEPQMLLMLGGSGAGKGTFLKQWKEREEDLAPGAARLGDFVAHGLDEYLEYVPEYLQTIKHPDSVYKDAADACYPGAAIPAAKQAGGQIIAKKVHLIYEETGKNLDRIKKKVLPPFVEAGYRVTIVLIDNDAETAIARAAGRFQATGRYAPDDYVRGTFGNCFTSYSELKKMDVVSEAIYCDNSGQSMRCWPDGPRPARPLVPEGLLLKGPPEYKAGGGKGPGQGEL